MIQFLEWLDLPEGAREETEAMTEFITLLWMQYYLRSRVGVAAAHLNRQFWEDLQ